MVFAFLRMLRCAQIFPSLAWLVQLIIHTVPKMGYFLTVFALICVSFALAFLLVFKTRRTEHDSHIMGLDDELQFNFFGVSVFQARLEARDLHLSPPSYTSLLYYG